MKVVKCGQTNYISMFPLLIPALVSFSFLMPNFMYSFLIQRKRNSALKFSLLLIGNTSICSVTNSAQACGLQLQYMYVYYIFVLKYCRIHDVKELYLTSEYS